SPKLDHLIAFCIVQAKEKVQTKVSSVDAFQEIKLSIDIPHKFQDAKTQDIPAGSFINIIQVHLSILFISKLLYSNITGKCTKNTINNLVLHFSGSHIHPKYYLCVEVDVSRSLSIIFIWLTDFLPICFIVTDFDLFIICNLHHKQNMIVWCLLQHFLFVIIWT
ncbi:hypothetical protein ACJX0J_019325, partial [Zea mays]